MKLKVGMYVRFKKLTNETKIGQIKEINGDIYDLDNHDVTSKEHIIGKPSYDIISLITVGDYVNGYKVSLKGYDYQPFVQCDYPVENGLTNHYKFYEQAIKSVVTKELFEIAQYRIGE